jgi:hypothetical protein
VSTRAEPVVKAARARSASCQEQLAEQMPVEELPTPELRALAESAFDPDEPAAATSAAEEGDWERCEPLASAT